MKNLQKLPQEQLDKQVNATKAYVQRQKRKGVDIKDAEIDLCYLEREEEHRQRNRDLHAAYLKELEAQKAEMERLMKEEEEALREKESEFNVAYTEEDFYDE